MSRKWFLLIGLGLGVVASVLGAYVWLIVNVGGPLSWSHTPLSMSSPDCTVVLHTRAKSLLPPTEYEYTLSLFFDKKHMTIDIPDDSGGGDPLVVYALESTDADVDSLTALLLVMRGYAAVVDTRFARACEFETYRYHLDVREDRELIEREVMDAWEARFAVSRWRYVATFHRTREAGWVVGLHDGWTCPEEVTAAQEN